MIVVDRIEGDVAVLEIDGKRIDVPLSALPPGTKEGDELVLSLQKVSASDAKERLERLKKTAKQGPDEFDL